MSPQVRQLLEMIRFSHTVFALPFALLAAVMAWSARSADGSVAAFRWQDLCGILVCMVAARSAAMTFNRIADRKIDAQNMRTAQRHLPAGKITLSTAVIFTVICCGVFELGTLLFFPNRLPLYLSLPVLCVLLCYSYSKRWTWLAHFWLGFSLMLAPVAAWVAIRGQEVMAAPRDLVPVVLLGMAVLFWVAGFDIIYACQDFEFDRQHRLRSVPARLGVGPALKLAAVCHFVAVIFLAALPRSSRLGGPELGWGWLYGIGLAAIASLLAYEHWLVRPDDLSRVNRAFFEVNAIISLGLFVIGSVDLLLI